MIANVSANKYLPADDLWQDLVVSILSVNSHSVEKTYRHIEGLRQQGLFDPEKLADLDQSEIATRLKKGGYDRGDFMTNLIALRLTCLGQFVRNMGLEVCKKAISGKDRKSIEHFLASVKGVGPRVLSNFGLLREI